MYRNYIKRILDFSLALIAILCLSPLLIIVTIWLHFANKGAGAFFIQERPGQDEKIFTVIKFKSMTDERDANGYLLPDSKRLTHIGLLIRATSIDELPQLFNVLKGDMAFIGPRPLSPVYLFYYNDKERQRHNVRPGITGWAQVNGRTSISWPDRFDLDLYYVNNVSLLLDTKIFLLTIYKVFKRENVGEDTSNAISFHDIRIQEWKEEGRTDLIEKAKTNLNAYFNTIKR